MPLDLPTAQQELDDARALLAALQEQVREGDETVTAQQIADQKELIALAELRVTAAERAEQQAAAADLHARATAVGDQIRDLVTADSTAPLVAAVQAVMTAVQNLATAADTREAGIRAAARTGESMNAELGRSPNTPWPTSAYGFRAQIIPPVNVVALGQGRAVATPLGDLLGTAVSAALVGRPDALRTAARRIEGLPQGIANVTAGVPGLADALRFTKEEWAQLEEHARYEASSQGRRPVAEEVPA